MLRSPSTITGYAAQPDGSLVEIGTFPPVSTAFGGLRTVWNTIVSLTSPKGCVPTDLLPCGRLAVNHYVNGPHVYAVDKNTGQLTLFRVMPAPILGNSGSSISYKSDGSQLFSGDYFAKTVRTVFNVETAPVPQFFTSFDGNVVTVKINPVEDRMAVGTDPGGDVTRPTEVHILDLSSGVPMELGTVLTGGFGTTGGMAFATDRQLVVANLISSSLSVVDLNLMKTVGAPVLLSRPAMNPVEVVFEPTGNRFYVACRSGHVAGYAFLNGQIVELQGSPWPTGNIETQNVAVNASGTLLWALNSGNIFGNKPPTITSFSIDSAGRLKRVSQTLVRNSNYYPTGIAVYPPTLTKSPVTESTPREKKEKIRSDLSALAAGAPDEPRLQQAADAITRSLVLNFWIDNSHLNPQLGHQVFDDEKAAVRRLLEAKNDKKNTIPSFTLDDFIRRIVDVDRQLAKIVIDEATKTVGSNQTELARAGADFTAGDLDANTGNPTKAIDEYKSAWRHALMAVGKL